MILPLYEIGITTQDSGAPGLCPLKAHLQLNQQQVRSAGVCILEFASITSLHLQSFLPGLRWHFPPQIMLEISPVIFPES